MPILTTTPEWTKYLSDDDFSRTIRNQLIVWSNIFHWRKYRWLSQEELAKKAKITQAIVSELEGWDYNPSMELLAKISNALQIKIELLTKEKFNRRFFEALDYFVSRLKDVDVLKLMKLIYFADLNSQQDLWYKLTWLDYYRRYAWPFNSDIYIINDYFDKKGKIFENKQNLAKRIALTKEDEKFLEKIVKKYWNMSSTEIRDLSYQTEPMKGCKKTNEYKMWDKIF